MSTEFALDLRLARRKAGLTQRDAALLLGVHQSRVSALERGRALPTLQQICSLSLIFGRSFEALFAQIMATTKQGISRRIKNLPGTVRSCMGTFNREATLQKLERRLQAQPEGYGA